MSLFNFKRKPALTTNKAGGAAYQQSAEMELVSILLTSFIQDQFYRKAGETVLDIRQLVDKVNPEFAAKAAVYARNEFGMRSASHVLAASIAEKASGQAWARHFYDKIIRRPDDMLEIVATYQAQGGKGLTNAMKKGFAAAIGRFDAYQLAKYRSEQKQWKMVDLVNLVHPKANQHNNAGLQQLVAGQLKNQRTWEAQLSMAGQKAEDSVEKQALKAQVWEDLLLNNQLGYLALLRNLRNIAGQASEETLNRAIALLTNRHAIKKSLVMPFQLLVAMDAIRESDAPQKNRIAAALSQALDISLDNVPKLPGKTLVVLDDSGSMAAMARGTGFGKRSCLTLGAVFAAALFKANDADLMRFSDNASYVKANRDDSTMHIAQGLIDNAKAAGTNFHAIFDAARCRYDRIVILSDMQGWMGISTPQGVFAQYKQRYHVQTHLYSFDLQGHGSLQFPEREVYCLAGFSDKVFDLMRSLETDRNVLLNTINAVSLTQDTLHFS